MQAKFVNEAIGDVLKPKSEVDIKKNLDSSLHHKLKMDLMRICANFWKDLGIKFGEINDPEIIDNFYESFYKKSVYVDVHSRVLNGSPFKAEYSYLTSDRETSYNQLAGFIMLKGGTLSQNISIIAMTLLKHI